MCFRYEGKTNASPALMDAILLDLVKHKQYPQLFLHLVTDDPQSVINNITELIKKEKKIAVFSKIIELWPN